MSTVSARQINAFIQKVENFYRNCGRAFVWRRTRDPYHILVSEIMLQQTQVSRVAIKYPEFIRRFPTIQHIAHAPLAEVLRAWSGLGYNRRAKMLRSLAVEVLKKHGGKLPRSGKELMTLPGVGQSTAGAIEAFAFNKPAVFIETNIRRAFIHHFTGTKREVSDKDLIPLIKICAAHVRSPRVWYWALMDYGSHLPKKVSNPNRKSKHYKKQSKFSGSDRQVRGVIIRVLLKEGRAADKKIIQSIKEFPPPQVKKNLKALSREGLLAHSRGEYTLSK